MSKFILLGLDGACPDIITEGIERGFLPNFKRLRERGCCAENLPFPSSVTPGNWTSIATGSKPWTHLISDFGVHTPGAELDEMHMVFDKWANNRAEFAWDYFSDRGEKAATINYPGSMPQTKPHHLAIGAYGFPSEASDPYTIAPARGLFGGTAEPLDPYGWKNHERLELQPAHGLSPADNFKATFQATFNIGDQILTGFSGKYSYTIYLGIDSMGPAVVIVDEDKNLLVLHENEWSPYVEKQFNRDVSFFQKWQTAPLEEGPITGEFRFRLVMADPGTGGLILYITNTYPKYDFSSQPDISRALRDEIGHYSDNLPISSFINGWIDAEGIVDEFWLQGLWQAKAAVRLVNDYGCNAVFTKWHGFDKFYHQLMQKIDPMGNGFDPAQYEYYENIHHEFLIIADTMVGTVLDGLQPDTSLVVVSDHGLMASRRAVWVNRLLAQNGYIKYQKDSAGKVIIDWSQTRAYVSAFLCLNVNLKGRDPQGIINPGPEFEHLKEEIIELLRDWKDPLTNRHVLTDVFDVRKDGAFYGMGTDWDGDIRYFTAAGYTLYRSTRVDGDDLVTDTVGPYMGDHGSCRPTTRFGRGSELGIFYAAGKGFRKGFKRGFPIQPIDIMPTLLHITEKPAMKDMEGSVLHELIEG